YHYVTALCPGGSSKKLPMGPSKRYLLVANAGDCRAILSHGGGAIEMSKDHWPLCIKERKRIESLGGYIDDGYLNDQLGVTHALGN
ncbi:putative protein phosphatase 2C 27, partial [Glycine soja]